MSKINRKVFPWKCKDSHRLEVFSDKFLTQKYNLHSKKTEQFWNILKKNELTTSTVLKDNLINHVYSFFMIHFSIWFLVIFIIIVSFNIVVPLVLISMLRTTTEFTACQLLFAVWTSTGSAPGHCNK